MKPPPPLPPQPPSLPPARIDVGQLKLEMEARVGPERARHYFGYLTRLLSQSLSSPEFQKLCLSTIGQENIPLHNQLVRSILKNAVQATKAPTLLSPPIVKGTPKPPRDVGVDRPALPVPPRPGLSNGHMLPPSPRKSRSNVRDRRVKDRPSPLGPNGRIDIASVANENSEPNSNPCDLKRPMYHRQGGEAELPTKRSRVEKPFEVVPTENGEDLGQIDALSVARGPIRAPLGIPFCSASLGGGRRAPPVTATASGASNYDSGYLQSTQQLRKRIESKAEALGLEGVSMDVIDLLNKGVDAYLRQMIGSCFQLVRSRSGHEPIIKQPVEKQEPHRKPINGVWSRNHTNVQSTSTGPSQVTPQASIQGTLQDFRVAMELKPQQLGENWPLLLEKIALSSYEE